MPPNHKESHDKRLCARSTKVTDRGDSCALLISKRAQQRNTDHPASSLRTSTMRKIAATRAITTTSSTTQPAAAGGYSNALSSVAIADTTPALLPPLST